MRNRVMSEETRLKMSNSHKNKTSWSKGKPWSEARRNAHNNKINKQ
jgi:hypothetical protein